MRSRLRRIPSGSPYFTAGILGHNRRGGPGSGPLLGPAGRGQMGALGIGLAGVVFAVSHLMSLSEDKKRALSQQKIEAELCVAAAGKLEAGRSYTVDAARFRELLPDIVRLDPSAKNTLAIFQRPALEIKRNTAVDILAVTTYADKDGRMIFTIVPPRPARPQTAEISLPPKFSCPMT